MKWFLVLIVVLNLAVAGYGAFKQRPPADVHAQEISPEQVKLLPPDWQPASAPGGGQCTAEGGGLHAANRGAEAGRPGQGGFAADGSKAGQGGSLGRKPSPR
jgi:hypothetical protein